MLKTFLKLAAAGVVLVYGQAYAFHSGGVAECGGCHQMHDAASSSFLLIRADASSVCLSCHEHAGDTGPSSYHISTAATDLTPTAPPKQRTPGGDFAWLKRSYSDTGIGYNEPGDRHGHNIVAASSGYTADATNVTAPGGGAVLGSNLGCTSCHDQHSSIRRFDAAGTSWGRTGLPIAGSGSYDNSAPPLAGKTAVGTYRILRGGGVTGVSNDASVSGATFSSIFMAVAPSTYNRKEDVSETRVAYGLNTGAWCGTCHPNMHSGAGNYHPVDQAINGFSANYNAYVSSGIMTGTGATFTSLVPFNENTTDFTTLASHAKNGTVMAGPTANDQVSCMSCHRGHASGFSDMVRWQIENEFLTKADSLGNGFYCATDSPVSSGRCALGRTTVEVQAAYYDRPVSKLGIWQRSLCNKCHAKD
ncbi:MAG TPA: cytochrome c3 family protein [Anaeromyxobacteraceae bacterium]|nr:cytochrome c3 family protein [Anaeromyxobacteraceae bacterium]